MTQDIEKVELLGVFLGQRAPDFQAETQSGETVRLSDLRGKVVFLDFWATWCAPCVKEIPILKKAIKRYGDKGLVVLGVSFDAEAEALSRYAAKKKVNWPQIWDEAGDESELARLYNVSGIPATFLIDPEGRVIGKDLRGRKLLKAIANQIEKIEKPIPIPDSEVASR